MLKKTEKDIIIEHFLYFNLKLCIFINCHKKNIKIHLKKESFVYNKIFHPVLLYPYNIIYNFQITNKYI